MDDFLEAIVKHLLKIESKSFKPTGMETKEAFIARRKNALRKSLAHSFTQGLRGYKILRDELNDPSYDIDLAAINLQDLSPPIILYKAFGWDERQLTGIYQAACRLYQDRRYNEAVDSFTFLTLISPLAAGSWKALSICYAAIKKAEEAEEALALSQVLRGAENGS